jgi:mono/diheme cytochrome c family protein
VEPVVFFASEQMKKTFLAVWLVAMVSVAFAEQDETPAIKPEQVKAGAALYGQHCSACHGPRMKDPEGAFDLRTFPPDQYSRFIQSVTKGKASMPPWGGLLKPDEITSLWAYVVAGERQ